MTDVAARNDAPSDEMYAFPASFAQHRLWILDQLDPGRGTYNVPMQYTITGAVDVHAIGASVTALVQRHEILRTVFHQSDSGDLLQVVQPARPIAIEFVHHEGMSAPHTDEWCGMQANKPFDLGNGPLMRASILRISSDVHVLSIVVHHIVFDGWSMNILQRELAVLYNAFCAKQQPALSELPVQYADFTVWQREQIASPDANANLNYWKHQLRTPLPTLELRTDRPRQTAREHKRGQVAVEINEPTAREVQQLARSASTTAFTVLLTAFQVLLHRHSGQNDLIVGTPVSGRASPDIEGIIGCFVNTLSIRADFEGSPTFQRMLDRTRATMISALANDDVPFEQIVAVVRPDRAQGRNPIFQTLFSLYEPADALSLDGLSIVTREAFLDTAKVDLQLLLQTAASGFSGTLEFDADLFDVETVARLAQHFETLVEAAVANPEAAIGTLAMLGEAERRTLLHEWNMTDVPYRANATVPQLIAERVALMPNAIAASDELRQLTYRELELRANAVSDRLVSLGVGPDGIVALCVERSLAMLVGAFGIMQAGGAYLALDPTYPGQRLSHMLDDASPIVIVADKHSAKRLPSRDVPLVLLDEFMTLRDPNNAAPAARNIQTQPIAGTALSSENLAYVVYTSGSTGTPKGVGVEHRALVNLLMSMAREPGFTSDDILLAVTSLSFDIAALELWLPLISGGRVVIAPRSATIDGERLAALIDASRATMLQATPATWRLLLAAGWQGSRELTMLSGGEVLSPTLATQLLPRGRALWNMYGPAETTIWSSAARIIADASITLGRPIANTVMRVLNEQLEVQPVGVAGELFIGGSGLARGYVNDSERTALRFVSDPYADGQRLYRTGDRVRWRNDGTLDFIGRLDDQVKLRGHRIELAEVELAVASCPDVEACAVVVRDVGAITAPREAGGKQPLVKAEPSEQQLVAYFVARNGASPLPDAIRAAVRRILPPAMTPDLFIRIDVLPLGPTGKVDRRALLTIEAPVQRNTALLAFPRSPIEYDLVQIWQRLLGVSPIGIREDFFEIGGHSLLAVQMLAEIERVRGQRVPLATLFDNATIQGLARALELVVRADQEPPVVVVRGEASGRPFAFVHGDTTGGGWYCRRLAPLIGSDVPVIVLGTLDCTTPGSPRSIEHIAALHVRRLLDVQAQGPYRIGGFCIGGLIAFEMARQLRLAGHVVDSVILIDASAHASVTALLKPVAAVLRRAIVRDMRWERRIASLQRVLYYSTRLTELGRSSRDERMKWARRLCARAWRRFAVRNSSRSSDNSDVNALKANVPIDAALVEFRARPATRVFDAQWQLASVYVPGPYDGHVDIIATNALRSIPGVETAYGWSRVADARVHHVSADHLEVVTTELPALAVVIRLCLAQTTPGAVP